MPVSVIRNMDDKFTVLSVDDDKFFLHSIKRTLTLKSFHVEIRVIVATNRDLEVEVKDGRFRAGLY